MNDNDSSSKAPEPKLPSNFNALTFTASCPTCGAPVEFASTGSVMAVCEYCQTTVIREGDSLKAQGKQSLTIEDYSPLQIGSVGRFDDSEFAIIGRIQLRYEQGVWNEWYLLFDDGRNGWLSEALGQYSLTFEGVQARLPAYRHLAINDTVTFNDVTYQVTDRRTAQAIAGEGELPYMVDGGWQTCVIDAQYRRQFITLDYGESGEDGLPIVYQGQAVDLEELDMQLLKDDSQIKADAGQAGSTANDFTTLTPTETAASTSIHISNIECPNCGSAIPYIEGKTDFVICPTCHTESKLAGSTAEMLEVHSAMQHFDSSLPLGAKARVAAADLAGVKPFASSASSKAVDDLTTSQQSAKAEAYHDYVVIGIMRLNEVGEMAQWTEYLLYSLTDGFLWLSEESNGWFVSRVLSEIPEVKGKSLLYDNRKWRPSDDYYQNQVIFAIGAFNWQVKVNDKNTLRDYVNGNDVITSEQTSREITYTIAQPLAYSKLKDWFGDYLSNKASTAKSNNASNGSLKGLLKIHALLQVIVLFMNGGSIMTAVIAGILIFLTYYTESSSTRAKRLGIDTADPFDYDDFLAKFLSIAIIVVALIISYSIGANSRPANGTNANSNPGGGIILLPGGGSSSSGRGGFSSSGSHK